MLLPPCPTARLCPPAPHGLAVPRDSNLARIIGVRRLVTLATTTLLRRPFLGCLLFPCRQSGQSLLIQKVLAANSPHGLILFDGVCVLCSRGCGFVNKRDRRGYFRFVPMQLAEGRPLAEQLGINPDCPDSFAFVENGHAFVKSEAVLRIARELPRWQWTWLFHFMPRVIRDAIYDLVARNRYRWFGRRDACMLPNSDRSWPS
ncbi:MAG TPA: DCC1-like thiol-disulfide oxidoreductase family protein [Pseudolabrys sp.]